MDVLELVEFKTTEGRKDFLLEYLHVPGFDTGTRYSTAVQGCSYDSVCTRERVSIKEGGV